jgi:trypsin
MSDGTATTTTATTALPRRALGLVLAALALGALLWVAGATAGTKVVGGSAIEIGQAPWQVLVLQERFGRPTTLCGGAILDATRILTAAHCVVTGGGSPTAASDVAVRAGISHYNSPRPSDVVQDRRVANVRIHPGYSFADSGSPDDIAVVYLASPLDLTAPGVRPIALPVPGTMYPAGQKVGLAGFGRQSGFSDADGSLNWMDTQLTEQAQCAGSDNAVILCAAAEQVAVCSGDSGSGLVANGTIVGVASTGSVRCPRGGGGQYTNVAAPEILRFIQGEDNPPSAPRRTKLGAIGWPTAMQVGQAVGCEPGGWTGEPAYVYAFVDGATGAVLQRSPLDTYTLKARDLGRTIACRVAATTEGGTGLMLTVPSGRAVQPAPRLTAGTAVTRAGRRIVMRVTFAGMKDVKGTAQICIRPVVRVGNRACGRARLTGAARLTAGVRVAVKTTAPSGLLRVGVAASLSDGRTLTTVGKIRVRK